MDHRDGEASADTSPCDAPGFQPPSWSLVEAQQSVPAPTDRQEPRHRPSSEGRGDGNWRRPTVEGARRGARIETDSAQPVMSRVLQHVDERVPDLARRAQGVGVMAVAHDLAASAPNRVQRARDAHHQPAHAARQRSAFEHASRCVATQVGQTGSHAHRQVHMTRLRAVRCHLRAIEKCKFRPDRSDSSRAGESGTVRLESANFA
jgi:hypothetical protein